MTNTILWIIQIILGVKGVSTAVSHGLQHGKPSMRQAMEKMGRTSKPLLSLVAVMNLLCALGLILPGALPAAAGLTPVFAALLAGLLLLSLICHVRFREKPVIVADIILSLLAAFGAYGRWFLAPLVKG